MERDWQVGNRVQKSDAGRSFVVGTVSERITAEREGRYYDRASGTYQSKETYLEKITVKWDDGSEDTVKPWAVEKEDTDLDREFRKIAPGILSQINEKLAIADKAIAEEKGIPFHSHVSPLSQSYMTRSFEALWDGVSDHVVQEVTQAYSDNGGYYGWVHSAVCF